MSHENTRADVARRYAGQGPCEEVWFSEIVLDADHGLWLRYTILDGAVRECAVWGVLFSRDGVDVAKKLAMPLMLGNGTAFSAGDQRLDVDGATGDVDGLSWQLTFADRDRRHAHVPVALARAGIASRDYRTAMLDLRVSGTVTAGKRTFVLNDAPGVLGHIFGKRHGLFTWAWGHCNAFVDAPDVVFEGLSARIDVRGRALPALTSFVLLVDGRRHAFSLARTLVGGRSKYGHDHWTFRATQPGVRIEGEWTLPARPALAAYTDTDGSTTWCRNSRLSSLRLEIAEEGLPVRVVDSEVAAFELGGRPRPAGAPDL